MSKEMLDALWHILLFLFPVLGVAIIQMLRGQNQKIKEIHACVDRRFDAVIEKRSVQHEENIQRLTALEKGQECVEQRLDKMEKKLDDALMERSR